MVVDYYKLIISIGVCLAVGFISGFWTSSSISSWYAHLHKPSFNPPNWIFGPVWTLLYILMGVALYLVWNDTASVNVAMTFFIIQLVLNFFWSYLFFSLKNPLIAFIEILFLLLMIIITTIEFYPISNAAAYLLIPYILWVSFASVLNLSILLLNK